MKNYIIVAAIAFITGAVGVKFLFPTVQEKIVEKQVDVIQKDTVTEVREVTKPDGSRETITVIVDKSKEKKESSKVIAIAKPDWHLSVAAVGLKDRYYQLQLERRVIGEIHVGVLANTKKEIGLTIGMSF